MTGLFGTLHPDRRAADVSLHQVRLRTASHDPFAFANLFDFGRDELLNFFNGGDFAQFDVALWPPADVEVVKTGYDKFAAEINRLFGIKLFIRLLSPVATINPSVTTRVSTREKASSATKILPLVRMDQRESRHPLALTPVRRRRPEKSE